MTDTFMNFLNDMQRIHDKKAHDYSSEGDRYSNFSRASILSSWFPHNDQVFATLIGIKLARLAELRSAGKTPNNESIRDTFVDLANYVVLWGSRVQDSEDKCVDEACPAVVSKTYPPFKTFPPLDKKECDCPVQEKEWDLDPQCPRCARLRKGYANKSTPTEGAYPVRS